MAHLKALYIIRITRLTSYSAEPIPLSSDIVSTVFALTLRLSSHGAWVGRERLTLAVGLPDVQL